MVEVSRWLIGVVAAVTAVGGLLADYFIPWSGRQHIKNPAWPPHAKFHNGQTIFMGLALGVMSIAILIGWQSLGSRGILLAAILTSLYWICLLAAPIFPGTAWTDPEFEAITPSPLGLHPQQLISFVLLAMLILAVLLAFV